MKIYIPRDLHSVLVEFANEANQSLASYIITHLYKLADSKTSKTKEGVVNEYGSNPTN